METYCHNVFATRLDAQYEVKSNPGNNIDRLIELYDDASTLDLAVCPYSFNPYPMRSWRNRRAHIGLLPEMCKEKHAASKFSGPGT